MLEEIRKQLINEIEDTYLNECESRDVCNLIRYFNFNLDNQPDYKSAWNELKESQSTNCAYVNLGEELEVKFEELEQKYKLGGE